MIHSVRDIKDLLEILTGERNPSLLTLDVNTRDAVRLNNEFLHPVLKWCDNPLVTGFVTGLTAVVSDESSDDALRPGKDQPDKLAKLNHGTYPAYCWPGGLLLLYKVYHEDYGEEWVCNYCAQNVRDGKRKGLPLRVVAWKVHTSGMPYQCPMCSSYRDGQLDSVL